MSVCVVAVVLLVLYICVDVNYFIRTFVTVYCGYLFQRRRPITDTTTIYGICTTQDVDFFLNHMNNARYLRELDFARFHFYALTGIYDEAKKRHTIGVQAASSVRYRRAIPIFSAYKVETKLLWWDDKALYLEHRFVTLRDQFVRAIVLSKAAIVNCNVNDIMAEAFPELSERPAIPNDLKLWRESNEASSQQLRKDA